MTEKKRSWTDNFDKDKNGNGKSLAFKDLCEHIWVTYDSSRVSREGYHRRGEETSKTTPALSAFGV